MLLALALLASPADAGTKAVLGVHHEWTAPMADSGGTLGGGIGGDVGLGFNFKIARLIPEIGATYYYNSGVVTPRLGGRFLFGFIVMPGVYTHVNSAFGGPFNGELGFDAGVSLDIAVPFVRFGGYGGLMFQGGEGGAGIPDQNFVAGIQIAFSIPLKAVKAATPGI